MNASASMTPSPCCASGPPPGTGSAWDCFAIFFGLPETRELHPGVLDEDAVYVFTHGHCHSFAEALRQLVPAAELIFAFDLLEGGEDEGVQGHVLVRIEGRYLDARGWVDERTEAEDANRAFEREWDRVLPIAPRGWRAYEGDWLALRTSDALPFAAALLGRLQIPIDSRPGTTRGGEEVCGCTGS